MYCPECGEKMEDGALFCHSCGSKVKTDEVDLDKQNYVEGENVLETAPESNDEVKNENIFTDSKPENNSTVQSENDDWWENSSKLKKILIVVGGIIAAVIVITLICVFLNKFWVPVFFIVIVGGFIVTMLTGSKQEKMEAKKNFIKYAVGAIAFICIGVFVMHSNTESGENYRNNALISEVQDSYLSSYSTSVSIEKAFKSYFKKCKWSSYKEKGDSYVVFSGSCKYLGDDTDVKITFKVTGDNFNISSLELDGIQQNDITLLYLLDSVYNKTF